MSAHSPAAKRAALRQIPEEDPEFQIAPMIDILLVLLVFFMSISSTEVLQTNDKVKLPIAKDAKDKDKTQGANKGQTIVNVLWDPIRNGGVIDMNEKTYGLPSDIIPELTKRARPEPERAHPRARGQASALRVHEAAFESDRPGRREQSDLLRRRQGSKVTLHSLTIN